MTVKHDVEHTFPAGLNAAQTPVPLHFDLPLQQGWKVYYEQLTDGAILADDAYWLVQANGSGAIGAGDSHSIRITPDGTVYSGYSIYRTLADRPMVLFSLLLIIFGILAFAIGLVGELIIFTHAKK